VEQGDEPRSLRPSLSSAEKETCQLRAIAVVRIAVRIVVRIGVRIVVRIGVRIVVRIGETEVVASPGSRGAAAPGAPHHARFRRDGVERLTAAVTALLREDRLLPQPLRAKVLCARQSVVRRKSPESDPISNFPEAVFGTTSRLVRRKPPMRSNGRLRITSGLPVTWTQSPRLPSLPFRPCSFVLTVVN